MSPGSIAHKKVYVGNRPQRLSLQLVKQLLIQEKGSREMYARCTTSWARRKHGGVGKGHDGHTGVEVCLPTLPGPLSLS